MQSPLPVIVLTARVRATTAERIGPGAGGAWSRRTALKELLGRIGKAIRPARPAAVRTVVFPGGLADLDRHEVRFDDGGRSDLSEREQELLGYLATHAGRAISRDELLGRVWGLNPAGITTRTIDMHIARLREKLHDDPSHPRIVLTVRGQGYMLAAPEGPR